MASAQNAVTITRRPPDIEDYIDMVRRYRSWIVAPMFAGLVIATVAAFLWPDTYISVAVMRITPQQIPDKLVPSAINTQVVDRLQQMTTEILSRGSLAEIIQKPSLDLYKKERTKLPMEDIVQDMRNRSIRIAPAPSLSGGMGRERYASAFTISFSYTDRYKAQQVVRELVTKFTEQNFNVQRTQATVTATFLNDELKQAKQELDAKNTALARFKLQNPGKLPDQTAANGSALQTFRLQLMNLSGQLAAAQSDKTILETNLENLRSKLSFAQSNLVETIANAPTAAPDRGDRYANIDRQIGEANGKLSASREFLGSNHPDVIAQKAALDLLLRTRADMEKQEASRPVPPPSTATTRQVTNPGVAQTIEELKAEINTMRATIAAKQSHIDELVRARADIEKEVAIYQRRLEEAPLNEQQYVTLTSDAALAKQTYEDAVKKYQLSETSKDLQEHQAGESLEVLDPANLPDTPAAPNRPLWALIGALSGLGLGVALAAGREVKDASLKNLKDVRAYTNMPVLSSIPLLENALLVRRKRRLVWLAWSSAIIIGCILMSGSMYYHYTSM